MNKGKHFTRVCLDCGKVMENVAGNLRFCASCRRERHNQYCRDYRAHNEKPARVMWYTVWDAKTGDLLASGTSEIVPGGWATRARTALRLPSAMGSAAAIELTSTHLRGNVSTAARWTACRRYALYEKSPPVRQHRRAARDDGFTTPHHPDDITKSEVLQ